MNIGPLEIKPRRVVIFIGIVILILLVMDFNSRLEDMIRLSNTAATVRVQATQIMHTQLALETAVAFATSDAAVQDWARIQNSMIQPGDVPVQPLPVQQATPLSLATPVPLPTPVSNWEIWMELLFGKK